MNNIFTAVDLARAVTRAGVRLDRPVAEGFLRAFERQGLVEETEAGWTLTERGRWMSQELAETRGDKP